MAANAIYDTQSNQTLHEYITIFYNYLGYQAFPFKQPDLLKSLKGDGLIKQNMLTLFNVD